MNLHRFLENSKIIVGSSWVLGFLELYFQVTPIPSFVIWAIMGISILIHVGQAFLFFNRFKDRSDSIGKDLLLILVFGMAHLHKFMEQEANNGD